MREILVREFKSIKFKDSLVRKYREIGKLASTMKFIIDRKRCDDPPLQGLSEARRGRVFPGLTVIYPPRGALWGGGVYRYRGHGGLNPIIIKKRVYLSSKIYLMTLAK
jgi:hypothetical protein